MLISVILLTHNRQLLVARALEALSRQTLSPLQYEIIVVADSCADNTVEVINYLSPASPAPVRLIEVSVRSVAKARNAGAALARGKYLAFTDDDCLADRWWLERLLEAFQEPGVVGVGGRTITIAEKRTPLTHQVENEGKMDVFPHCNAAFRRDAFQAVGGLSEEFGSYLNEDVELGWRLESLGRLRYAPEALVVHPPRPESFKAKVRFVRFFETEFTLAARNPALYRKYRRSPWYFIYWRILVRSHLRAAKAALGDLLKRRRPDHCLIRLALIAARSSYLLYLFPRFQKAAAAVRGKFNGVRGLKLTPG